MDEALVQPNSDVPAGEPPPASALPEERPVSAAAAWISEWTVTLLLLVFVTTTLVQSFVIPTPSMEDTLMIGDHVLVDKLAYAPSGAFSKYLLPYAPVQRGDIVVFRYPEDIQQTFVKRVIGLPGDRIRIETKQVFLNGQPVKEKYKFHKAAGFDAYRDTFPIPGYSSMRGGQEMLDRHIKNDEIVVPDNCYFVMGDNRDHSLDSRFWGFVPRGNIIGKPLLIYWSYQTTTDRLTGPLMSREHFWDLVTNFFRKTRWSRTFRLIRGERVE
jgi:signal peptidase I